MKSKIILSIYFLGLVSISGCKKDSDVSTSNGQSTTSFANTHYQFSLKCDGQTFSAVDGIDGFSNESFSFDHDTSTFTEWINFSFILSGDSSKPQLAFVRSILKMQGELVNINDLRQLFHPGNINYSTNPLDGIILDFEKNDSTHMSTSLNSQFDQTGSTFVVTDTLTESSFLGPRFKIKATFNCKVYDQFQVAHEITEGTVVCHFQVYP